MKEKLYNEYINRLIKDSEDDFFSEIEHNKNKTWELIEHRLEKKKIIPLWFYYAAALIILFFGITNFYKIQIDKKDRTITELTKQIALLANNKQTEQVKYISKVDTISIVKNKKIYIHIAQKDTLFVHDTVFQEITLRDTVYIKEKKTNIITKNNIDKIQHNKQIEPMNIKKRKRFKFLFGKPDFSKNTSETAPQFLSFRTGIK